MALREAMVKRGLHVSEYGVKDDATGETTRCATEEEVYERLGLPWIPPELREGRGELEAAATGSLPALIELGDLRGDLHSHTVLSDGRQEVEAMLEGARARGYEYLAITDHSASHGFGNDVQPDALRAQIERVRALDAELDGFDLLIGTETNILTDGSLDYEDDLLAELDWVVASVHTSFAMSEADMTARMIAAMEHPYVDQIGHPTGRKIETRPAYMIDMERVIEAAARTHTMLEINAAPDRRDLNEIHARAAADGGRADPRQLRCALGPQPRADALRDRHGAPRLADARAGREHATVVRAGVAAQARPRRRMNQGFWAGVRAGIPFAAAGGLLSASFGVLATDVGMPGWAAVRDVGDRVRGLGPDRRAHDPRGRRRARVGDRRRGADELALPAHGDRDRAVAARRPGQAGRPGADRGRRVVGDRLRRRGRLRPHAAVRLERDPVHDLGAGDGGRRARAATRSAIRRRSAWTRSTRPSSSRC